MARYQFTDEDRKKAGRRGLEALAARYTDGDIARAGKLLSKMGMYVTDPAPQNGAWQFEDIPHEIKTKLNLRRWGHVEKNDQLPF